jgi:hypothetical protein
MRCDNGAKGKRGIVFAMTKIAQIGAALLIALLAGSALANEREHRLGLGVTALRFSRPNLTEVVIPLHYRFRQGVLGFELGRDTFIDRGAIGLLLGIYRVGATVLLHDGNVIAPYVLARGNVVLDLPEDKVARAWDIGLHYTLAIGSDMRLSDPSGNLQKLGFSGTFRETTWHRREQLGSPIAFTNRIIGFMAPCLHVDGSRRWIPPTGGLHRRMRRRLFDLLVA